MKKRYYILATIFLLTIVLRLTLAFQTPYFSDSESYFYQRQIDHIMDTGKPLFEDPLSYSGRFYLFPPLFVYILAIFAKISPLTLKIILNLVASTLCIIVYFLSYQFSKNIKLSLTTAFLSSFIPIYFSKTFNSITPISFYVPLIFLSLYLLIQIRTDTKYLKYFLATIFILPLISPISILLIFALLIYLLIIKIENEEYSKSDFEVILFSTFLVIWEIMLIYKKAFQAHGPSIIFQNIPSQILNNYFFSTNYLQSAYLIGVLPFILGIYVFYKYTFREKSKYIYLLIGFALSTFALLSLKLIEQKIGLIFLGITLVLVVSIYLKNSFIYLRKSKFEKYENYFLGLFIFLIILTSVIPSVVYSVAELKEDNSMDPYLFLKSIGGNYVVLGTIQEGHLISYANKKNVADTNFLFIDDPGLIYSHISEIYTTSSETKALELLNHYNVIYILITDEVKSSYGITDLSYVEDNCFNKIYDKNGSKIYAVRCTLK